MRPTLGRVITYTRAGATATAVPEEYTGRITRVVPNVIEDEGGHENDFEAWLAVDIHNAARGETWFTPGPIKYDPEGRDNTWRWPDRA